MEAEKLTRDHARLQALKRWRRVHEARKAQLGSPTDLVIPTAIAVIAGQIERLEHEIADIAAYERLGESHEAYCPLCGAELKAEVAIAVCNACTTIIHVDCAQHNGGTCITVGCNGDLTILDLT